MNSVSHSFKSLFFYFVFGGACVTNLVVFFLCYRSSNSLRLVDVQTCSKFGRKQTYLFRPNLIICHNLCVVLFLVRYSIRHFTRPTISTGRPVLWLVLRFRSFVLVKAFTLTMKTHCLQHKDFVITWVRII